MISVRSVAELFAATFKCNPKIKWAFCPFDSVVVSVILSVTRFQKSADIM
jgi:hypothetical protein